MGKKKAELVVPIKKPAKKEATLKEKE